MKFMSHIRAMRSHANLILPFTDLARCFLVGLEDFIKLVAGNIHGTNYFTTYYVIPFTLSH